MKKKFCSCMKRKWMLQLWENLNQLIRWINLWWENINNNNNKWSNQGTKDFLIVQNQGMFQILSSIAVETIKSLLEKKQKSMILGEMLLFSIFFNFGKF